MHTLLLESRLTALLQDVVVYPEQEHSAPDEAIAKENAFTNRSAIRRLALPRPSTHRATVRRHDPPACGRVPRAARVGLHALHRGANRNHRLWIEENR